MAKSTTTTTDLLSIYEKASAVATFPGVSASLGGWNAKAVQIDVSGYSQQYVESPAHDPANLMFVMVTYGPGSKRPLTVSEISAAQFDRFAAIGYDPRSSDADEPAAIRTALDLAEGIAPNVLRHQAKGKKEKAGGYRFA
ncbi:hypothetical protein WK24_15195 [Burkholderia vietnamiensis]|uniref:hypothetical protein n=1 Tax=Burkholderia cepacia complex TaxID=87882 RepID=UPI00075D64FE|nr:MULTISPECIES: hypothetical protein [Burkholderia cepacia complex]KVR67312.1 hypothetical protein WK24_15195 [Burkholderia vietnamiensis]MCA7919417.1 hypothetical protein [Burkholderia contaminans]UUX37161.1 hypothetical protein NTJ56_17750 [Burkholderia contaminans]